MNRYTRKTVLREALVIAGGVAFCIPLYLLASISLKSTTEALFHPLTVPLSPHWASYSEALSSGGVGGSGMKRAILNSMIITVGSVICLVFIGAPTAWVLARRLGKLTTIAYMLFLLGIVIPWELGLVPIYIAMRHLHLIGSYLGIILFYTGLFMPLTVFLYTGFMRTLPRDYEEAAQVDGATRRRAFFRVVLPLLLPVTGTIAVLDGLFVWNQFFTQVIFLSGTDKTTVPVTVYSLANANYDQWNVTFAAVALALAPLLVFFLFAQRTMIRGFSGGVRG